MGDAKASSTTSAKKGRFVFMKTDRGMYPFSILKQYETDAKSERLTEEKETRSLDMHGLVKHPFKTQSLLDLQDNCTYFDACVRQVAKDVVGHGWTLKPIEEPKEGEKETDDKKKEREAIEGFLRDVNDEDETIERVFEKLMIDWGVIGWWNLEVAREKEAIRGIWQTPAHQMYVHVDKDRYAQKIMQKYQWFKRFGTAGDVQKNTGKFVKESVNPGREMIMYRNYYAQSGYYGAPNILSGVGAIKGYIGIRDYNIAFFENYGIPAYMIMLEGEWEEESAKQINDFLDVEIKRSDNAHKTGIFEVPTGNKVTIEPLGIEIKEGSFKLLRKDLRDEILVAYRMPPYRIGIAETGSLGGSTAEQSLPNYNESIILPLQNDTAAIITKLLIREGMGFESFRFEWKELETRNVDALAIRWEKLFGMASINANYIRRELGEPKVEHGEQYFISGVYLALGEETVQMMEKRQQAELSIIRQEFNKILEEVRKAKADSLKAAIKSEEEV
jgi:capsid portal protein